MSREEFWKYACALSLSPNRYCPGDTPMHRKIASISTKKSTCSSTQLMKIQKPAVLKLLRMAFRSSRSGKRGIW